MFEYYDDLKQIGETKTCSTCSEVTPPLHKGECTDQDRYKNQRHCVRKYITIPGVGVKWIENWCEHWVFYDNRWRSDYWGWHRTDFLDPS